VAEEEPRRSGAAAISDNRKQPINLVKPLTAGFVDVSLICQTGTRPRLSMSTRPGYHRQSAA
jgi:hypothetical protein